MKDLNLFKKYTKNQEVSYNFKLGFVLSNRPHFNSVYLVRVPFLTGIAVHKISKMDVEMNYFMLASLYTVFVFPARAKSQSWQ